MFLVWRWKSINICHVWTLRKKPFALVILWYSWYYGRTEIYIYKICPSVISQYHNITPRNVFSLEMEINKYLSCMNLTQKTFELVILWYLWYYGRTEIYIYRICPSVISQYHNITPRNVFSLEMEINKYLSCMNLTQKTLWACDIVIFVILRTDRNPYT